jgi:hypothetical protein
MPTRHPLQRYLDDTEMTRAEIARRAGISRAVITRALRGDRDLGRYAASEIARATADMYIRGETKVQPLTREELCPKLARPREAA